MRTAHSRSGLWAIGAGSAFVLLLLSAPAAQRIAPAFAFESVLQLLRATRAAIVEGYRVAPALMLGLGFSIAFPFVAVTYRVLHRPRALPSAPGLYRLETDDPDPERADLADDAAPHALQPFVEIEANGKHARCAISGDMLRIGSEDDNDIRIASRAVHRYHAAIYREDYNDWHITDLSGAEGNGLIVNGRRCCEARLNDGDLIELGPGKLRFRAGSS